MRRRVVLPPPEGPIRTRLCTLSSCSDNPSSTRCESNRFDKLASLSLKAQFPLPSAQPEGQGQGQHQVAGSQREVTFQGAVGDRVDIAGSQGKFVHGDNGQ